MVSLSIFFPCFNDAKSISKLINNAISTARKITNNFEVIVVDDASTDGSRKILRRLEKRHSVLEVIYHDKNTGYGGALRSGFKSATKDMIFYTDGDGQYDVRELPILVNLMTKDVDFINGIKMSRNDPTYRIVVGNIYSLAARWLFWLPTYDVDCDFRLIRKHIIKKLNLQSNSGAICVELVKKSQKAGAKFRQVSIHHYSRDWGHSQFFRPKRIINTFIELIYLWWDLIVKIK